MSRPRMRAKTSVRYAQQNGAAAVELALLLVVLLSLVAGMVAFGRAFWYYDALSKATRDGARFLSSAKSATANVALDASLQQQAKTKVVTAATQASVPNFTSSDVAVSCEPDCNAPDYVTVRVAAYPLSLGAWLPLFFSSGETALQAELSPYTSMRYLR